MSNVIKLNSGNFWSVVSDSDSKVFVDVWASWCAPCRAVEPIVDELSEIHQDVVFSKLNIEDGFDIANSLKIFSVPTFLFFKDGEEVGRIVNINMEDVRDVISEHVSLLC
ncbi:MAG: thioredoxin family protein [bacterium]|nr:thioredoxin family protein [bacterium]